MQIVDKATHCLIQLLQLYAQQSEKSCQIYFVEHHMQFLIQTLDIDRKPIIKRVLKCIYWALIQMEYQIKLQQDRIQALEKHVERLILSDDKSINQTAKEIYKKLHEMKRQEQMRVGR